jgi:ferredoxin
MNGPTITKDCIGCGLCAMRCPVGAISVSKRAGVSGAVVKVPDTSDDIYAIESDEDVFFVQRDKLAQMLKWSDEDPDELVNMLYIQSLPLRQGHFYPLVAALFTLAGFPVWRPVQGDTNNRIDLILIDRDDSLPVEVKSRTEVSVINVKSVQQALENKLILDKRAFLKSRPSSSTLVVGYDYPPARSDVIELIDDIHQAYDIRIGLVSIKQLYKLALKRSMTGIPPSRTVLNSLKGPL